MLLLSEIVKLLNQNCHNLLSSEKQKYESAVNTLDECNRLLSECKDRFSDCNEKYIKLQNECEKKEQALNVYYFVKVFSDRVILFDLIVLYNLHLFGLFLAGGISFTIKLFEIDLEIKVLNKKNQKKLVRIVRQFLIENPYSPLLFMFLIILLTNLIIYLINLI